MKKAKNKKKGSDFQIIKAQIDDAFNYIVESRRYIYLSVLLFIGSMLAGFLFSQHLTGLDTFLKQIVDKTKDMSGLTLILFIFYNNLSVAFTGIFLGIFAGLFPIGNSIMNGLVLGYVFAKIYGISGISEFWRIIPHGIFELPAIFISLGLGV